MTISTIGINGALPQHIVDLKSRMEELQVQLGSGRKSQTYGGLGNLRSLSLDMRGEISRIQGFMTTITMVDLRLDVMESALEGMQSVVEDLHGAWLVAPYEVGADGRSQIQYTAEAGLSELVQLLNSETLDRHLFAGRDTASPPVASDKAILQGEGARAGLAQVISERELADLGTGGLGRLTIPAAAGPVASIAEDVAGHPFGFKLTSVTSTLTGTTVSGPGGAPQAIDVTFSATPPLAGETISIEVALPDGSSTQIQLTATDSTSPAAGEFTISTDENVTAANFETSLRTETARVASIELRAASAVQAANEFFDYDATTPPQRVDGPPFDSATALIDATVNDTVYWYEGDLDTAARDSALAKIDESYTVSYGARADEAALANAVKQAALLAVTRYDETVAGDEARYEALRLRGLPAVGGGNGFASVSEVATELAHRHIAIETAGNRHKEALGFAQGVLTDTEGVDLEEIGVKFLRLQTQLQASYETTAILSRLTLADYL